MAVTLSTAGPYFASGPISFSSLRETFRAKVRKVSSSSSETTDEDLDEGSISASELLRNTNTLDENPIVPDCVENENISSYDYPDGYDNIDKSELSGKNLSINDIRNSIKYYYWTFPSSDEEENVNLLADDGTNDWYFTIDRNINKVAFIDGIIGSNNTLLNAVRLNTDNDPQLAGAYNLTIDVYGQIYGCGGSGGIASAPDGTDGGNAMYIKSNGGNNIVVNVRPGCKIWSGGGGGAKGHTGNNGTAATCKQSKKFTQVCQQGAFIKCPSGWNQTSSGEDCCEWKRGCNANNWWRWCEETISTSIPTAGYGGDGGPGRGYNNYDPEQSLSGADGGGSSCPSCPSGYTQSGGSCSTDGQDGGEGGEWGENGENKTKNLSVYQGGSPGYAVRRLPLSESAISVQGSINSDTVKGFYLI